MLVITKHLLDRDVFEMVESRWPRVRAHGLGLGRMRDVGSG